MLFATEDDVVACYRLFLGREPDAEGARTFNALVKAGNYPTTKLATLFLSSSEAQSRIAREEAEAGKVELVRLPWGCIYVTPRWNDINRGVFDSGTYEPHITKFLQATLKPSDTFVDIGANIGFFTLLAASKGCRVYAFEPHGKNVWLMQKSLAANSLSAEIFPMALADAARLYLYAPTRGNGQLSPLTDDAPTDEQIVLRTTTLDDALSDVLPKVIKIDVEGAEGLVLKGAQRILDLKPIVVSEFSAATLPNVSGVSPEEYLDQFVRRGYSLAVLHSDSTLIELSPSELIKASLASDANLVDFVAIPA